MKIKLLLLVILLYGLSITIAQPRNGDWTVPCDFGNFVLTVGCQGTCITTIKYTWSNFHCDGITYVSGSIQSSKSGGWAITNNQFTIQTSLGSNQTMTINGTFNQPGDAVSGTYSANIYGTICSGNWGPITTSAEMIENEIPQNFFLSQNYPNPFNPLTIIKYSIPKDCYVTLKIIDAAGKEVSTLVDEEKPVGNYEVNFNAIRFSSGIYFYRIEAGDFVQTKKMILLK